ncbi:MAG: AMP-binding protein [Kofleriaceae bacterium]|nr:AMP-binding protein [Kofleriaceae bacterium]
MTQLLTLLARHQMHDLVALADEPVSAAQFRAQVTHLAAALPAGPPGAEVVLVCHDRYFFAASLLACWARGFVVALPPNAQTQAVKELRQRPEVLTVLHDSDGMHGLDVRGLLETNSPPVRSTETSQPLSYEPDRTLVVVYTSGSTGTPLACPKTAAQLIGEANLLTSTFDLTPRDRVCATVPPHHIYGLLFGVLTPLVSGAAFTRSTALHIEPLVALLTEQKVTTLVSVPAHLRALAAVTPPPSIPSLTKVFSSGAALSPVTARGLASGLGVRVIEVLGSSETGGIAWRDTPERGWAVFDGVSVSVGPDRRMQIDSPFLDTRLPRPWTTGDAIELGADGTFTHLGRADGVLKVGSIRVSVADLEARLLGLPGVIDAAVIAVHVGGARGSEAWAAVVGEGLVPADVRAALMRYFDPVALPRRIRVVAQLPRGPNGKLPYDSVKALFDGAVG